MQHVPSATRSQLFESVTIEIEGGGILAVEVGDPSVKTPVGIVIFVHGFGGNKDETGSSVLLQRNASLADLRLFFTTGAVLGSAGEFESTPLQVHVEDFRRVVDWAGVRFQESSGSVCAVGLSLGAAVIGLALRANVPLTGAAYLSPAVRPNLVMWPRYKRDGTWHAVKTRGIVQKPGATVLQAEKYWSPCVTPTWAAVPSM